MTPNELLTAAWPAVDFACRRAARRSPRLDADDLAQTAAVRVLAKARRYDPGRGTPGTWGRRVAERVAMQSLRRHRHVGVKAGPLPDFLPADPRCPDPAAEAERADLLRVMASALPAALARLSARERAAVTQFYGLADGDRVQFATLTQASAHRSLAMKKLVRWLRPKLLGRDGGAGAAP